MIKKRLIGFPCRWIIIWTRRWGDFQESVFLLFISCLIYRCNPVGCILMMMIESQSIPHSLILSLTYSFSFSLPLLAWWLPSTYLLKINIRSQSKFILRSSSITFSFFFSSFHNHLIPPTLIFCSLPLSPFSPGIILLPLRRWNKQKKEKNTRWFFFFSLSLTLWIMLQFDDFLSPVVVYHHLFNDANQTLSSHWWANKSSG